VSRLDLNYDSANDYPDRPLNKSISSSNFTNDKKGFNIPKSIDDIWNSGSSKN
jgi:hypothetical protein